MIGLLEFGPIIDMCLVTVVKKTKLVQTQVLRRALSDEHQALLCLKLCSDMEEVRDDISIQLPRNYYCIILSPRLLFLPPVKLSK